MSTLVASADVEAVIRSALQAQGYETSAERLHGETGTDIVATSACSVHRPMG
jgi:hypothetical protein